VQADQLRRRHPGEGVDLGTQLAQRGEDVHGDLVLGQDGPVDHDDLPSAQRWRHRLDRGQLQDPERRGDLIGCPGRPLRPPGEHAARLPPVPHQRTAVDGRDRVEGELQSGHHPEVPTPAAQRPEQLGVGTGVDAHELAVGEHDLEGDHAVALQAEAAPEPPDASAERVPADRDVRGRPVQRHQPVRRHRRDDVLPRHPAPDAGRAPVRVDGDPGQPRRAQQHHVPEVLERAGIVPRGLRRDPQPGPGSRPDHRHHLVRGPGPDDRRGPLLHRDVPRQPCGVVAGVAGKMDGSGTGRT
jgi:hypothetical protein